MPVGWNHSLSTSTIVCPHFFTIIFTFSRMYFLESLFLLGQGTILFSSRKKYLILVFITNIRRPHFFKNRKKPFFHFALLADSVIHTPTKQYFFSQAPIFCLWVRPIFGSICQVSVRRKNN